MSKRKSNLWKLEKRFTELEKPVSSQRDIVVAEVVSVFAVVAWMGAMTLIP